VTAGSPEKCKACRDLGADRAIDYKTEDFVEVIGKETGGRGVDVVLDMVGGDYIPRSIKAMAPDARHVSIAFLRGPKVELNVEPVMRKRLTLTGSTLRPRSVADKAAIGAELYEKVWPLLSSGRVKPVMFRTFPLAKAADAHALMESSEHIGKIALAVRNEGA
jgi:NADPH:quinone reductase-like Zn-dependent oxidoreductase